MTTSDKKSWRDRGWGAVQGMSNDLGTVLLGASAIFIVRAFPASNCGDCNEFDFVSLAASGVFFVVGIVIRLLSKPHDE